MFNNVFVLAPGGTLVQDGKSCRTETCLFGGPDSMEHVKGWEQVRNLKKVIQFKPLVGLMSQLLKSHY